MIVAEIPCPDSSLKLESYSALYDLRRKGKNVGKAHRKLEASDENKWLLSMKSEASVMIVKFKYSQQTNFSWVNNKPRPDNFIQTDTNNFRSTKVHKQNFDWQQMQETGSYKKKKWQLALKPEIQDRQTSILSLRVDLLAQNCSTQSSETYRYPVSYKGKLNDDVYQFIAEETIQTPEGEFQTLKFEKTHKNKRRISYFWLAKKLDYIPIRIQQIKEGEEQADMLLKSVTF